MTPSELRVRIRVLAGVPDYSAWTEVCALLDTMSDDTVRGHVEEIEAELGGWAPHLRVVPPRWVELLLTGQRQPRAQLCRTLDLSGPLDRADPWRALDSPDIAGITILGVGYCGLDEAAMPELARRVARIGVHRLAVDGNHIGLGIAHLFQLSRDGVLASIDATDCGLAADGVLATIVADGVEIGLDELDLGINYLQPRHVEQIARIPGLDRVRRLGLGHNKFLAAGASVLAERAPLRGLRELNLGGTQCGDVGVAALAASPDLARLDTLSLASCQITDAGAASLAEAVSMAALRKLNLTFNRITAAGVRVLLDSTRLPALAELELRNNEVADDIVEVLDSPVRMARLSSISLDDAWLSDGARAALLASPRPGAALDLMFMREDDEP
ncbi:hypothetical protein [Catellatospora sp. NPDC049609]|uniref:hypothetical protein n=1 Tax=Catellatospora sp. NPDC049609 TaxID=3155505 RepID=UPI0034259F74